MSDFININQYEFNAAVRNTDTLSDLTAEVRVLEQKVDELVTANNIDNTQFDGNEAAFDQRVLDVLSDNDYSNDDEVRDIAESAVRDIDWSDIVNEYVTEDVVKDALGLGRYDDLMDRDAVEDVAREVVQEWDIDEFVTANAVEDMMDERLSGYVTKGEASMVGGDGSNLNEQALLGMLNVLVKQVGVLSEDLAALRNLCGLEPRDYMTRLFDIDTLKRGAFENVRMTTTEEDA